MMSVVHTIGAAAVCVVVGVTGCGKDEQPTAGRPAEPAEGQRPAEPAATRETPAATRPAVGHPLADAKVGQWVLVEQPDGKRVKHTVTEVTAEAIMIEIEFFVAQQDELVHSAKQTISFRTDAGRETAEDLGTETLSVAGRPIACNVTQSKLDGVLRKTWTSPAVPLFGAVKSVLIVDGKERVVQRLLDFGPK